MSRSRRRLSWSIPLALGLSVVLAGTALAAVTFSAQTKVGPVYTWNYGNSLESTSTKLHSVFATDCVPPSNTCSTFASDSGPYQGVYYMKSNITSPPSWSAPIRLSQSALQAERPTLASAGNNVYAGWVTQTSYDAYDPAAARVFYIRSSTNEGGSFSPAVRVTPLTGRVDYPIMAAVEGHLYVIYTDANTGNIRLATSINNGATFTTKTVGKTTSDAGDGEGFYGYPSIGASGTNVAIGWFADNGGKKVVKVSNNSGGSFTATSASTTVTATSQNDGTHYMEFGGADDGVTNRVAAIYETPTGVDVRVYNGTSLSAPTTVFPWPTTIGTKTYDGSYGPAVQPYGTDGLAMAFPGCVVTAQTPDDCDYSLNKVREEMLYRESLGGTLGAIKVVQNSGTTAQTLNDAASIVVTGSGATTKRFIQYNGWNAPYNNYELYMKVASGQGP